MLRCASWYKVGLVIWGVIVGSGFALAVMWAGWETAIYGLVRVSSDNWMEMAADIFQKITYAFPLLALPFACTICRDQGSNTEVD